MGAERLLEIVERIDAAQALHGLNLGAIGLYGKGQAGSHAVAVHQHRAGATDAVLAADMGSREIDILAEEVDQEKARLDLANMADAVDGYRDRNPVVHHRASSRARATAASRVRRTTTPARWRL